MAGVDLTLVERMVGVDLILASDRALVAVVDTEPDMKVDMKVNTALEAILLYLAGRAQAMGQRCWEDTVSKMGYRCWTGGARYYRPLDLSIELVVEVAVVVVVVVVAVVAVAGIVHQSCLGEP